MSKHILNSPKSLVADALAGLAWSNPQLEVYDTTAILRTIKPEKVYLLCGGGAGHEPAHAAFVGDGILGAAVSGQVFASPNSAQIEEALERLSVGKGVLIIVKNYTGDVLHFGLARERWAASHPGSNDVRLLVVGDDVAVPRSAGKLTGRRGLASTVLVYKISGALAAKGATLDEVEHLAKIVSERSATIGVGLEHCQVPGTEKSEAHLGDDEIEIGMGIHNEPGNKRVSPLPSAAKLVDELLVALTDTKDVERAFLPLKLDGKDQVILLINNLGGLPELELSVVVKEAHEWLHHKGISVERSLSGSYMSSLNLPGFSISLVLLPREPVETGTSFSSRITFDQELVIEMLDAPASAPGWRYHYKGKPEARIQVENKKHKVVKKAESELKGPKPTDEKLFVAALEAALKEIIKAEPEITRYDQIAGDGDAGLTFKAGAEAISAKLNEGEISKTDVVQAFNTISAIIDKAMGGTSGGLFSIFFAGLSRGFLEAQGGNEVATAAMWARALELALNTLYNYTLARPPSRTLVDPLSSFILTFAADLNFEAAFQEAKEAAEATRSLDATAGRAAYVDKAELQKADVPDAGAWGILKILEGIRDVLQHSKVDE